MGTLTRKTDPHQKCESRIPPVIGPRPTPSADTPAHTPMALARSTGSRNTLVMIDRVAGMMQAPPTPMSARVAMSMVGEVAMADRNEPVAKMVRPMVRKR